MMGFVTFDKVQSVYLSNRTSLSYVAGMTIVIISDISFKQYYNILKVVSINDGIYYIIEQMTIM